jgi:hypothetical protein
MQIRSHFQIYDSMAVEFPLSELEYSQNIDSKVIHSMWPFIEKKVSDAQIWQETKFRFKYLGVGPENEVRILGEVFFRTDNLSQIC